jgi:hypothetical protein
MGEKIKGVLPDGKVVLLVMPSADATRAARWTSCPREILSRY